MAEGVALKSRSHTLSGQPEPHSFSAAGATSFNCSRKRKEMQLRRQNLMFKIEQLRKKSVAEPNKKSR
jgi:hypothetical protein